MSFNIMSSQELSDAYRQIVDTYERLNNRENRKNSGGPEDVSQLDQMILDDSFKKVTSAYHGVLPLFEQNASKSSMKDWSAVSLLSLQIGTARFNQEKEFFSSMVQRVCQTVMIV